MAKIPRAQELGLQPDQAQQTRGVVNVPVPDTSGEKAAGRAQVEIGSKLFEFGQKLHQAQVDREVVNASRKTRDELDRAYRGLAESGDDPTTFEQRYQEATNKIIAENAKLVPNSARELWSQRAKDWQLEGTFQTRSLVRTKQLEGARANLITDNETVLKQVGDLSLSRETVVANLTAQKGLNDRHVADGVSGKDDAARLNAVIDNGLQKDLLIRTRDSVEKLTMAGDDVGAETMIAEFDGTAEEQKALKQAREATQQDMRAAQNRAKADQREAEIKAANTFEMDVLKGNVGFRDLQAAVDRGDISINDQPALYRSIRAEADRRKTEAAAANKLTDAEKEEWKTWSQTAMYSLQSSATMTPAQFMLDPETQWDPQLYEIYKHMTPEDQRQLDRSRLEMRETGKTANEVDRIENMLVDEAKRIAPANWEVGSGKTKKTAQSVELAGYLRQAAAEMAPETGGAKLTPEQVRSAAALAVGRMKEGKNLPVVQWETYAYDFANSSDIDKGAYSESFAAFQKQYGRAPTPAEARAAYDQWVASQ